MFVHQLLCVEEFTSFNVLQVISGYDQDLWECHWRIDKSETNRNCILNLQSSKLHRDLVHLKL